MDKTLSVTVAFCSVWLLGYWIGYYSQNCVTVYGSVVIKHDSPVDGRSLPHDKPKHVNLFFAKYFGLDDGSEQHNILEGSGDHVGTEYIKASVVGQDHSSKVNTILSRLSDQGQVLIAHRGEVFTVKRDDSNIFDLMPSNIPPEAYIILTNTLPTDSRFYPSVANGHIGTVIHSSKVFMNGVYNGAFIHTHRAVIPSTVSVVVNRTSSSAPTNHTYQLNLAEGVYSEQLASDDCIVTQRIYAHRTLNRLLVVEIEVIKTSSAHALTVNLANNKWTESDDITFVQKDSGLDGVNYQHGTTNFPERSDSNKTAVHVYYDTVPDVLTLPEGESSKTWVFVTSIATTSDEALEYYQKGEELLKNGSLKKSHIQAWADIWCSGIIYTEGNLMLAQTVIAGYYYILSSVPHVEDKTWPYVGISPTGLPTGDSQQDYQGHVFWDQDTWQYPPILFLHSDFAESMISNRKRIAAVAKKQSEAYGYKGMKFPWEAALTGYEVSPSSDCGNYEIHINGDISQSIMQYFHTTNNTQLLTEYADIVAGIADFWVSRMTYNETLKKYELKHVLPADEDAGPVDNNVYTSAIAEVSLNNAIQVGQRLGQPTQHWEAVRDNIYIPFDEYLQFHPEYDGYPFVGNGIMVKQADVVLLGYPLNINLSDTVNRNDITFYAQVTRDSGPAMTWSIISINWLDLGEIDKGHSYFERNFGNVKGDFKVWSEVVTGGGAANFLTGIGGFLQNIIAGYGGFRLYKDRLSFNPTLPRNTTAIYFKDIDYLGSTLDFTVESEKISIELMKTISLSESAVTSLCVYCKRTGKQYALKLNAAIRLPRGRGVIMPSHMCTMKS